MNAFPAPLSSEHPSDRRHTRESAGREGQAGAAPNARQRAAGAAPTAAPGRLGPISPTVRGPRDVAELRLWLIDAWRPSGILANLNDVSNAVVWSSGSTVERDFVRTTAEWEFDTVCAASLWYVGESMMDLLEVAERDVPTDLRRADLAPPDRAGFAVFARPLAGLDAEGTGLPLAVHAVAWAPVNVYDMHGDFEGTGLGISSYGFAVFDGFGPLWYPLGRGDWIDRIDEHPMPMPDYKLASMIEDRRRLAALWLLASQPRLASRIATPPPRPTAKRYARRNLPVPDVQLIVLRRPPTVEHEHEGDGRHIGVRCIVRGHWRQQAVGPHWSQRRPTFIHEHLRGPDGAPLRVRDDVVKALVR